MTPMGATQAGAEFATEKQMSNLDDKLREILVQVMPMNMSSSHRQTAIDAIAQIKQAFADENVPYGTGEFSFAEKAANEGYMTGQSWYDRFKEALRTAEPYDSNTVEWDEIDRVAKKASGLK